MISFSGVSSTTRSGVWLAQQVNSSYMNRMKHVYSVHHIVHTMHFDTGKYSATSAKEVADPKGKACVDTATLNQEKQGKGITVCTSASDHCTRTCLGRWSDCNR